MFNPIHALVRQPCAELGGALTRRGWCDAEPTLAARQHASYVAALRAAGLKVTVLPALKGQPDACFVEDCAVVFNGRALLTRPGAVVRQPEVESVGRVLKTKLECLDMDGAGRLDGGDVLRLGDRFFVGRSSRSDAGGIEALGRAFGVEVVAVDVGDALHLKSVATAIDEDCVLVLEGALEPDVFAGVARVLSVPRQEAVAANVLRIGASVLMPPGCPQTAEQINALGWEVVEVDASEFNKMDGALTCLSVCWS